MYANFSIANVSNGTGLTDYYVSNACPNFAIVPAGSKYYILNIIIVPDNRLEENELFRIYVDEPKALDGVVPIQADVIIMNDDGKLSLCITKVRQRYDPYDPF